MQRHVACNKDPGAIFCSLVAKTLYTSGSHCIQFRKKYLFFGSLTHTYTRIGECLPGGMHKELACPEPEGLDYEACFQWRNETCCTAEFTKQLSGPVITNVFEFRWDTCGNLSLRCQEYFKRVECFYR